MKKALEALASKAFTVSVQARLSVFPLENGRKRQCNCGKRWSNRKIRIARKRSRAFLPRIEAFALKQALFADIFFRCAVKLLFKKPEKIALAYEQPACYLANVCDAAQIFIYVSQSLGYERGKRFRISRKGLRKEADVEKQLGDQMREET